jgi:hypothetical protein
MHGGWMWIAEKKNQAHAALRLRFFYSTCSLTVFQHHSNQQNAMAIESSTHPPAYDPKWSNLLAVLTRTGFSCDFMRQPGYYADMESHCHVSSTETNKIKMCH